MSSTNRPIAVLISDIHFTLSTLEEASSSLLKAQFKAVLLKVPLVICGDTLDSKAVIRAEIANRLIELMSKHDCPETIMLVGNHDKINEKGQGHSLNFLKPYCVVIDSIRIGKLGNTDVVMIPYQSDSNVIKDFLKDEDCPKESIIIMHQGLQGSDSGEYIQDHSALTHEDIQDFRVISGHYHRRQDIKTGRPRKGALGMFSYIGNPYTLSFGEAEHPEKGFQILMDDGTLEFVPTNLRKHVVIETVYRETGWGFPAKTVNQNDILLVKAKGPKSKLNLLNKAEIKKALNFNGDFRLDLIPTDNEVDLNAVHTKNDMSQAELLDSMIDSLTTTDDNTKIRLKQLWKAFINKD